MPKAPMAVQTVNLAGKKIVILTQEAFEALMEKAGVLPPFPPSDKDGNSDAIAFVRAAMARTLVTRRIAAGWTQKELAKRAGARLETISRLEAGKHAPTRETATRLDGALKKAGR
jgi:DNA-binding XRE family transcriptional regulator